MNTLNKKTALFLIALSLTIVQPTFTWIPSYNTLKIFIKNIPHTTHTILTKNKTLIKRTIAISFVLCAAYKTTHSNPKKLDSQKTQMINLIKSKKVNPKPTLYQGIAMRLSAFLTPLLSQIQFRSA